MPGAESKLWRRISNSNRSTFMKRIENTLNPGMPDVYFISSGRGGMLELKVSSGKRKLRINYPPHQRIWARRHIENGGTHLLAVEHCGEVLWWYGEAAITPEQTDPFHRGTEFPCQLPS